MAATTHTPNNSSAITEVLWTMLQPLDSNIKLDLGNRLLASVKGNSTHHIKPALSEKIKNYKVSPFIASLSKVADEGEIVPSDENGRDACMELIGKIM